MIVIENTLVSDEIFEKKFVCDLSACKGACCVEGDSGAPITSAEVQELADNYDNISPYMRPEGRLAVEQQGLHVIDFDGELVTPLVEGKECAYVTFDRQGIAKCAIEQAWKEGKSTFRKPVSCHLYPIRVSKLKDFDALNYHHWPICESACSCGSKLDVKVYKFLKEAIIRQYGEEYYDHLENCDRLLMEQEK